MGKVDVIPGWNKISNKDGAVLTVILMPNVLTPLLKKQLEKIPTKKVGKPTYAPDEIPDQAYKNHDVVSVQTETDAIELLKTLFMLNIPNIVSGFIVDETQFSEYLAHKH